MCQTNVYLSMNKREFCTSGDVFMCLCCTSPANSNSSVASEQEESGSLKKPKHSSCITNSSGRPRTLIPIFFPPPTPAGKAHPSSSSPPIATAHLSSPPLFPGQQSASYLHPPPHTLLYVLPWSLPPPLRSHQNSHVTIQALPQTSRSQEWDSGIPTRIRARKHSALFTTTNFLPLHD